MKLTQLLKENQQEPKKFSPQVKKHFLEIVSTYNKYQDMMDRKSDLAEIAETLGGITEAAKTLALNETDGWFDKVTVKRNMSELDKLGSQFDKVAQEARDLDQRMAGLYEDMGHILSRYYKLGEISEETMKERLGIKESVKDCGCNTSNEAVVVHTRSSNGNIVSRLKEEDEELDEAGEDVNNAMIPSDVKIKLQKALDVLNGKKLTYPQKLQVLGRVLDSMGIDKKELNKVTQKIRTKLESTDNIEEISYDSQGSLKSTKKYKTLSDYEKVAKKGDFIWVGNDENKFKKAYKSHLLKVLGKDSEGNVIVTPFGRNNKATIPQKNMGVIVAEVLNEENPCWDGYEMVGMKMKNGKEVPNCVPKN